ncbi:MAG: hypothetical protein LBH86_02430 [Oscillospiraceae bacterium]|nr:hypothetical protein [Oscillospiraceae bacterium]
MTESEIEKTWTSGLSIKNVHFDVIGVNIWDKPTVPLLSYIRNGWALNEMICIFQTKPSEEQSLYIQEALSQMAGVRSVTLPAASETRAVAELIRNMLGYVALVSLLIIITINAIFYWINNSIPRFKTYILCGATNIKVIVLILNNSLFITLLSFLISLVAIGAITPSLERYEIIKALSFRENLIVGGTLCFLTLSLSFIKAVSLTRRETLYQI